MFRSYKETGKSGLQINVALKIRNMIIDAIPSHPGIQQVKQLTETLDKLEEELEALKKVSRLRKTRNAASYAIDVQTRILF